MKQSEVSRTERRKMLAIQAVLLLVIAVGVVCFAFFKADGSGSASRQESQAHKDFKTEISLDVANQPVEAESFAFDPNTADSTTLLRLGLTRQQVRNIYRYRASGGVFHRPEEFKKLYGLTVGQWHHLEPLIHIGEDFRYLAETEGAYNPERDSHPRSSMVQMTYSDSTRKKAFAGSDRQVYRDTTLYPRKLQAGEKVNLNTADTTALKSIPGIGSYYAQRIVQYREKLGGFSSLSQLNEIKNLPLGVEAYLSLDEVVAHGAGANGPSASVNVSKGIRKLRINHSTFREINNHPYINYYQTTVILNHIRLFGPIRSFQDLSTYEEFTPADFQRLEPYIDFSK